MFSNKYPPYALLTAPANATSFTTPVKPTSPNIPEFHAWFRVRLLITWFCPSNVALQPTFPPVPTCFDPQYVSNPARPVKSKSLQRTK